MSWLRLSLSVLWLCVWPLSAFSEQLLDPASSIQCVEDGVVDVRASIDAPVDLTSNPQVLPIAPTGLNPPICAIRGTSDIASVKLDPGNGLELPQGSISLGAGDILTLIWDHESQQWRSPNLSRATTDWQAILSLDGVSPIDVHDMVEYDNGQGNRLYLCGAFRKNAVVASYDPVSGELVSEFTIRGLPDIGLRCRKIAVFKGDIYIGTGSNFSAMPGAADVYRWDGTHVTKVLDTDDGDMYALSTSLDGEKLYAGGGTVYDDALPNGTGKLWGTDDGTQWKLIKDFGPEYEVVRWIAPDPYDGGRLYVSTRNSARLWSTVDDLTFEDHGAPPGMNAQIKSFTFHDGKMYLGGVAAAIWTFTRHPDTYTQLIDLAGMTKEVYHTDTCGDFVYFAARSNNSGGQVFQCNTEGCIIIYVDDVYSRAFHSVRTTSDGSIYLGTYIGADAAPYYSKLRMSSCSANP
ncbi:MAG: hypothetical protein PVG22_02720 [Chromatiales bacterium]|jgi:hypothetical protein